MSRMEAEKIITLPEYPGWRALIEIDQNPHEPEFEGGAPVVRYEYSFGWDVANTLSYGDPRGAKHIDALDRLVHNHGRAGVDAFDRYLRIFHGGRAAVTSSHVDQGSPNYVVFVTAEIMADWGNVPDVLTDEWVLEAASEWQSYIDGDCYDIVIQESIGVVTYRTNTIGGVRTTTGIDWEQPDDLDSQCGGYYGDIDGHVTSEATRMLIDCADSRKLDAGEVEITSMGGPIYLDPTTGEFSTDDKDDTNG